MEATRTNLYMTPEQAESLGRWALPGDTMAQVEIETADEGWLVVHQGDVVTSIEPDGTVHE